MFFFVPWISLESHILLKDIIIDTSSYTVSEQFTENTWLGNTYYNFCCSANVLNIRPRGFDRT